MNHAISYLSTYLGHIKVSDTYWYLLGECLPHTTAAVLRVAREYLDGVTGQRLADREEFVEARSATIAGWCRCRCWPRGGAPTWSVC